MRVVLDTGMPLCDSRAVGQMRWWAVFERSRVPSRIDAMLCYAIQQQLAVSGVISSWGCVASPSVVWKWADNKTPAQHAPQKARGAVGKRSELTRRSFCRSSWDSN